MSFKDVIDKVLKQVKISDVVGKYVELEKKGANHFGLCPFHKEKSPSFSVNDDKGIYHCFGCGESGNAVGFVMKYKELPFKKALSEVAEEAGIDLPEDFNLQKIAKDETEKEILAGINKKGALLYYQELKKEDNPAKEYLEKKRSVSPEMIKKFALGFAKDSWDFLTLHFKGFPKDTLLKTGLFGEGKNGIYDRFKNKVMFPIFDVRGSVVAFGSRVLDDSKPKYINSPETLLFKKREILYGLNFALPSIREKNSVFVVEGYMDVILMHQGGFENTVAALGTAFGDDHLKIISRYAKEAVFVFDGDEAGRKAAARSVEIALNNGFPVKILTLPEGLDPADFIVTKGKDAFDEYYKKEVLNWDDYLLSPVKNEKEPLSRKKKMQEILKSLTGRDPFIVNSLLEKISRVFEIEKKELDRYFNRIKNKTKPYEKKIEKKAEAVKHFSAELEIVLLFIHNPKLYLKHQDKISEAFFEDTENVLPIFQAFKESFSDETFREDLLFSLLSEELGKIVGRNLNSKKYRLEPERQLLDIFAFLRLENIKIQRQGVLDQIKEAEKEDDFERVLELMKEEQGLSREIHELKNKLKTV